MSEHNAETMEKNKNILQLILENFDEFERMQDFNEDRRRANLLFANADNFIEQQQKCLLEMSKDDVDFLNILCNKIKNKKILMTDMENFVEWKADVIYFNKLGQLVIAHPR